MAVSNEAAGEAGPARCWQREPGWLAAGFDDSLVMLDMDSGQYLGLNETAAVVWNLLEQPMTVAAIVEHLRRTFDVDHDACTAAVDRTLGALSEKGAVRTA